MWFLWEFDEGGGVGLIIWELWLVGLGGSWCGDGGWGRGLLIVGDGVGEVENVWIFWKGWVRVVDVIFWNCDGVVWGFLFVVGVCSVLSWMCWDR